jgi:hypothetical protein
MVEETMPSIIRRRDPERGTCLICDAPARWSARPPACAEVRAARLCDEHAQQVARRHDVYRAVSMAAGWPADEPLAAPRAGSAEAAPSEGGLRSAFREARDGAARVPEAVRQQLGQAPRPIDPPASG